MRRISAHISLVVSIALAIFGLTASPASAIDLPDGNYLCATGSLTLETTDVYAITGGFVSDGELCAGAVVIPEGAVSITPNAFDNDIALTSINIPSTVEEISSFAFSDARNLVKVTFAANSSLTTIGNRAFEDADNLTEITIPASVETIGDAAFSSADTLSSVDFESGSSLTSIGQWAFEYTSNLDYIALPQGLVTIGVSALENSSLQFIEIPESVTTFAPYSFSNLYGVTLYFHGEGPDLGVNTFLNTGNGTLFAATEANLETFPLTDGYWEVFTPAGVFYHVNYDSKGGTAVQPTPFRRGTGIYSADEYQLKTSSRIPTKEGALFSGWSLTDGGEVMTFPYYPEFVNDIDSDNDITLYAVWILPFDAATGNGFVNCSTSGSFIIADNVVTDSDSCLGTAAIPDSVTEIYSKAFQDSDLTSATFTAESKLKFIGDWAFDDSRLENIIIPAGVTTIGYRSFYDTSRLSSLTFESGSKLKVISDSAFQSSNLTSISIPASVTHIWTDAFYESNLETITFAADSKLVFIGIDSFADTSLESIEIPASVVGIDNYAFQDTSDLLTVTFAPGSKLTYLGGQAFSSSAITSIQIPAGITSLRNSTFDGSEDLTSIYFLGNAPSASWDTFNDIEGNPKAFVKSTATGFPAVNSLWYGLTVEIGVYDVAFSSNEGSAVPSDSFVADGAIADPATPTRDGYTFAGWSATDGGSAITFPYSPGVTSNITLFAKWTLTPSTPTVSIPTASTPAVVNKSVKSVSKSMAFSANSKVLTKAHKAALKKSVKISGLDATYVVTGTAGMLPGSTKAQVRKLAKLRANVIKAYLVKLGVNKANISIELKITNQGIVPKTKTLAKYLVS